jgi:hypothetical protein
MMAKRTRTPAQKRKEAIEKKRKYRAVVNATGDVKLARTYSRRSETRIAFELGIIVPDKTPRLVAESTRLKRRQEVIAYIEKTVYIERKRRPWMPPVGVKRPKPEEKPEPIDIDFDDETGRKRAPRSEDIPDVNEEKRDQWIRWNTEKNYPEKMEEQAQAINKSMGFDDKARYGWAILYFMYVYGVSEERAKSWITSESYEGGDIYRYLVAVFG